MIYTSESVALAALKVLANAPMNIPVPNLRLVTFEVAEGASINTLDIDELPAEWDDQPPSCTAGIGRAWIVSAESLMLRVPSVVPNGNGWNVLSSPLHPEFDKVKIVGISQFAFDKRLPRQI